MPLNLTVLVDWSYSIFSSSPITYTVTSSKFASNMSGSLNVMFSDNSWERKKDSVSKMGA